MTKENPEKDAFGQMMWACYKGRESCQIVERDDGYFEAYGDPKVYFSEYKDWQPIEQKAIDFVRGRVLDVGCGAGRHSLYLQEKGFDVLGIDSSPLAIKICKLRGLKNAKVMAIENLDFKPNSFDTIIMLGGNFGLVGSPEKAEMLLKKFYEITSTIARIIAGTRATYKTDKPVHLEYHRKNREKGQMGGQLRLRVRYEKAVTDWFNWLIVSKQEMEDLLTDTGWKISKTIESKDSAYIAIIEKE